MTHPTPVTDERLDEIERRARSADGLDPLTCDRAEMCIIDIFQGDAPVVVLALIADLRAARARVATLEGEIEVLKTKLFDAQTEEDR